MHHRIRIPLFVADEISEEMRTCDWLRNDTRVHAVAYSPGGRSYMWCQYPAAMLPWNRNRRPKK